MNTVYIVAAKRTPIGSFGGVFKDFSATDLGASIVKGTLEDAGIKPELIEELFFGNVVPSNLGQAPARQVAVKAGLAQSTPVTLINKVCASGMKATMIGAQSIQLGLNQIVAVGGMENMSQIPFYLDKARFGYGYGNGQMIDGLAKDGLTDPYQDKAMGCFADATAERFELTREMQDEYAINSYKRAAGAWASGEFAKEVLPVVLKDRKGNDVVISEDEEYKKVFFDKIPNLKPVFTKEGTVTAANASTINDGAACLILASEEAVEKHGLKPIAKISSSADGAREPEWFTIAPILAAEKSLGRAGLSLGDIDYFEVNEAFSAVPMAFAKHFDISYEKMNINGGAVSIGHPLGCSGARILVSLLNVLQSKGAKKGMAAICNGGGGASAMIVELI
ncbi:thiolase family protein [Jiulongibacter sediminis]|jgi:acetyl-CoA C-acetyltransferase|uniref:thiolase family protein n=1 Tax=Jiulongibacter sediminis TaxID=1605367 RepID=UPI0026E9B5A0|nr:thiolase family protein [Jiulongibacter sediminis]